MASHLSNPVTRPSDYAVIWTPISGSPITIDRGSLNLPGTEEAQEYSYTTDEETLKEVSQQAGYSQITLETVLDDNWGTFVGQALSGIHGTLVVSGKPGTTAAGKSWSFDAAMKQVTEPSMQSNNPEIPIYNISWATLKFNN